MKKLVCMLAIICIPWCARAHETLQAAVTVRGTNDTNVVVGRGTVWLTGNRMVCSITSPAFYSYAAIHGPATPGANAEQVFALGLGGCAADGDCGYRGEFYLTEAQIGEIRAGIWYLLLGNDRGQIVLDRVCRFKTTNEIEFAGFVIGRNPTNGEPRYLRFGRARFGLTGDNLSYEITIPAAYGPYGALIRYEPLNVRRDFIVADFGTVDCVPISATSGPPDAVDLELLPRCAIRGAVCVPASVVLSGDCVLRLGPPENPQLEWVPIVPVDTDQDGVPDYLDTCPDTSLNTVVNADGCGIEQLCRCDGPWKNHGEYVNGLMRVTARFVSDGLITPLQRRAILQDGNRSDCGRH